MHDTQTQDDEWLTVDETCARLHISRATFYRLRRRGTLAAVRMLRVPPPSGALRINYQDMIKALAAGPPPVAEATP